MLNPQNIDFNQVPKKFCDGAIGAFGKDFFSFGMTSGNNLDAYATTPQTMKSVSLWMAELVANYEKQFGEIDMKQPEIQSPIQISDLKQ